MDHNNPDLSGMTEEQVAEQLHLWYLEGTKKLDPNNYNAKAQKSYTELNEQQKDIDRYIAGKVMEALAVADKHGCQLGNQR